MVKRIGKGLKKGIPVGEKPVQNTNVELERLLASFGVKEDEGPKQDELRYLRTELLEPCKSQPRRFFDDTTIEELAESIRSTQGVIEPLAVCSLPNNRYEIIAGERRWRAANIIDLEIVPCIIKDSVDERTKLVISLVENIQREDLNVIDEAEGLFRLVQEFELSHEKVAAIVGRSRSTVTNMLRLLELSEECKTALAKGEIEMGHARAMLPLDVDEQGQVLKKCLSEKLTVRAVETLVKEILKGVDIESSKVVVVDEELLSLEQQFAQTYLSPIQIKKLKSGEIMVRFKNVDVFTKAFNSE